VARPRSGRNPEQARDEGGLSPHITPANVPNLPLSDHRHSLVTGQRSSCGWQTAKAQTRPDEALDAPMVLLNDVVQVFDLAQAREAPQLTLALQGRDRGRIGRVLVDRDRARVARMRLAQRLAEEALGGRSIPLGREQEVDRLAPAVHRPIQVGPVALHLDIRFIYPPRAVAPVQVRPDPLLQLRGISLDPTEQIPWARLVAPALWQSEGAEPPTLERPCKPSVLDLTNTLLSAPISRRSSCPWSSAVQPGSSPPSLRAAARRCRSIRCATVTSPVFLRACPNSRRKPVPGRGASFPSSSSRKQGWTGSGSTGSCKAKGSRAMSSIPPPSPRPVGGGGRRPIGSTARLWFAPCWPTSGASPGFVRWSRLRPRRRRTVAGSVVSARP